MKDSSDSLDVMFVLDTSYSMNQTDPDRISIEMLKLFTDISYLTHTRIGFVSFNDKIQSFQPLVALQTNKDKNDFKRNFDSIQRTGWTDTGLGLKKGFQLFAGNNPGRQKFLVLITDGEIDANVADKGRSATDSMQDINLVLGEAAAEKIPIYTVALGQNSIDMALLERISKKTSGATYTAAAPQDLIKVFNGIFASGFNSQIVPIASVTATGETQEIHVSIPDNHVAEANIMFLSSTALKEMQVFYGSNEIDFQNTEHYSSIKIPRPQQQDVRIVFKGVPQDVIKVNMLLHYDLKAQIQVANKPESGQALNCKAWLVDKSTGQPIVDKNLYSAFSATAVFRNLDTGEEIKVPALAEEDGWQIKHVFKKTGRYSVRVQAENNFYSVGADAVEFTVNDGAWLGKVTIFSLVIVIGAMIFYREKRAKPRFTGKLNAYFLRLSNPEEEVPPFTILMADIKKKKISLFEILESVSADQGLTEANDIWFTPGVDKTLILSHNSVCTILVGQNVLCKNQNYILHYGDKIYVTFPEYGEEIELDYKSVKSSGTVS